MIVNTYSAYDKKGCFYLPTFHARSDGEAARQFGDAVNSDRNLISEHPSDFALYRLGSFDDNSGKISSEEVPVFIAEAMSFLPPVTVVE